MYHDASKFGFFAVLHRKNGNTRQECYKLTDMPKVLGLLNPKLDFWISQADFIKPSRRVVNLARIGLLFADLDTYKIPWAHGRSPEDQAAWVIFHCHEMGIPSPSIIIFSGRGLQAKWFLTAPLPRQALPRWNACQRHLVDKMANVGADPAAKDASRVLRIINTVNSKSGQVCRVVHVEKDAAGLPVRYSFEYMSEILLPIARWDIEENRQKKEEKQKLKIIHGGKQSNLRGFSSRQLAWDRLEDLRRLAKIRGGIKEGDRMLHLFWRLNFLLLSGVCNSSNMYREAVELAKELDPSWNYRDKELMTLYAKAKKFESGEKVTYAGKEYPALYTPKNQTLISLFSITEEEQRQLKTIISPSMAKERDRVRQKNRRKDAGAKDRQEYLNEAEAKKNQS